LVFFNGIAKLAPSTWVDQARGNHAEGTHSLSQENPPKSSNEKKCHKWMREGMVMMMMRIHRLSGLGSSPGEFPQMPHKKKCVGDGTRIGTKFGFFLGWAFHLDDEN
jgi:hypothetical protein